MAKIILKGYIRPLAKVTNWSANPRFSPFRCSNTSSIRCFGTQKTGFSTQFYDFCKRSILVPSDEIEMIKIALVDYIALTHLEAGCIIFKVEQDTQNPRRFNVYEEFKDKASFELHQKRSKNSLWGEVTSNVERFYEIIERKS